MKTVGAAKFKAECLGLMDEVYLKGTRIQITKNGKPVAELVPPRKAKHPGENPLAFLYIGGGKIVGDIMSPAVPIEDYEALK